MLQATSMSSKSNKCVYIFTVVLIDGATIENNKCVQTGKLKGRSNVRIKIDVFFDSLKIEDA